MTRRTLTWAGLAALGLLFACASSGYAADVVYHGSLCNPVQEQAGQVFYDQHGIANLSNDSPLSVVCGATIAINANLSTVLAVVYDRHPTADVVCTLAPLDIRGVPIGSALSAASSGSSPNAQALTITPEQATQTIVLQCSLPAATSSGVSHLTTYRVISIP
jgi:hypothetical protein